MKFGRVLLIGFSLMLSSEFSIAQSPIATSQDARPSQDPSAMPVMLDIPAQSLEQALKVFSDTTHVALFYESSAISGRRSFALHGAFPPDVALRQMLQGTGLSIVSFQRGTMTILPPAEGSDAPELKRAKAAVGQFSHYLAAVQKSLDLAFCHAPAIANDPDEILARLWLAPSGEVRRADILSSTGSDRGDGVYLAMLGRLVIDARPPAAMPQPINLMMRPKQSRKSAICSPLGTSSGLSVHE